LFKLGDGRLIPGWAEALTLNKKGIQLIALALFGTLIAFGALTAAPGIQSAQASSANLIGTFTSAPAESTCAITGCHGGALTTNSDLLTIEAAPTSVISGNPEDRSYTITVRLMPEDTTRARWGFQMTVIKSDGHGVGMFLKGDDGQTSVPQQSGPTGDRSYIEHSADGTFAGKTDGAQWIFKWLPPADFSGSVTFYAAGCAANNNDRSNGDRVYTKNLSIATGPALPPVISDVRLKGAKLIVTGMNFDDEAFIFINDSKVKKTLRNDSTMLTGKKFGDLLQSGSTATISVQNGNGMRSEPPFQYVVP
jgi:hypothetical protein